MDKQRNKMMLERIFSHLNEAIQLCGELDLSGLKPLEQTEWDSRMKTCIDALEFTVVSVQKLSKFLSS